MTPLASWTSRSDGLTVAVGFSPRRKAPHEPASRSGACAASEGNGFHRRYATWPSRPPLRGLKPTATLTTSLRDGRKPRCVHSMGAHLFYEEINCKSENNLQSRSKRKRNPKGFNVNSRGCNPRFQQREATTLEGSNPQPTAFVRPFQGRRHFRPAYRGLPPTAIHIQTLRVWLFVGLPACQATIIRAKGANFSSRAASCGAAQAGSPRREPWVSAEGGPSRVAAKECPREAPVLSPLMGLGPFSPFSHGWRRGLPSRAAPRLSLGVRQELILSRNGKRPSPSIDGHWPPCQRDARTICRQPQRPTVAYLNVTHLKRI